MSAPHPNTGGSAAPKVTTTRSRALLRPLSSASGNSTRPVPPTSTTASTAPKSTAKLTRPMPPSPPQHITIDAATRIMGHCNDLQLPPTSFAAQAARVEELLKCALNATSTDDGRAKANVNITIQAGFNIMGSKNVLIFNGRNDQNREETETKDAAAPATIKAMTAKNDCGFGGRKRRAESEHVEGRSLGKKIKVEE